MKLYMAPGACSLSPHIALTEAGIDVEVEKVDLREHRTAKGVDFYTVNPKGSVPALVLDDGQLLTEGPAIVQYIADQKPASKLAPAAGTLERYHLQEWLNYISTELHKQFGPLFHKETPDAWKTHQRETITKQFDYVDKQLTGKSFLMGDTFTVADGYLFVILRWGKALGFEHAKWPSIASYYTRVAERPAVKKTLEAEGIKA